MNIDGIGGHLLSHIALAGDFPAMAVSRIIPSPSYRAKVLASLKSQKLIRTYYRDGLRSYRLTAAGREALLSNLPLRFGTILQKPPNLKSDLSRRLRRFQLAQVALTMEDAGVRFFPDEKVDLFSNSSPPLLPAYYSSLEIKALGIETVKIKNGRFCGVFLSEDKAWLIYYAGEGAMRWYRRSEIKTRAVLTHLLCRTWLPGRYQAEDVQAILIGRDMDTLGRLLATERCRDARIFRFDQTYEHFHFVPESDAGIHLLQLLLNGELLAQLKRVLSTTLTPRDPTANIENDGFMQDGTPVLFSFDGDAQRLLNFVRALQIQGRKGRAYCFDFQQKVFAEYAAGTITFQAISMDKFRQSFYRG